MWFTFVNAFYRTARFVICDYEKGKGVDFDYLFLIIFDCIDLK